MKERIIIIDTFIHKKARISRDEFLERFLYVKAIRTRDYNLSFYFNSADKWEIMEHFHYLINTGDFSKQKIIPHIPFAFSIPKLLYNWMKETPLNVIQKQIMFWLSGYYVFNSFREYVPGELLEHIWKEVSRIVKDYYPVNFIDRIKEEDEFEERGQYEKAHQENIKYYLNAAESFVGSSLPEIFVDPSRSPSCFDMDYEWGLNDELSFGYSISYLTDRDWEVVIKEKLNDDLLRIESDKEMFEKWKYTYKMYDLRKNNIFSFYSNAITKNVPRKSIPQNIKDKIWRRDLGKCVKCGSNEKIEIDHIIPVSKGGKNTYRNLQLLCEKCNRSKYNKIE